MKRPLIFLTILLALTFTGCKNPYIYEQYESIDNKSWMYADTKKFSADLEANMDAGYLINLNLRHTSSYPYQNVYVKIYTTFPDGTRKESIEDIPLADKKGNWYGKGRGDIIDAQIILQEKVIIEEAGSYSFEVEQFMRIEPLEEILEIGLSIRNLSE